MTTPACLYAVTVLVDQLVGHTAAIAMHAVWMACILPTTAPKMWVVSAAIHAALSAAAIATTGLSTIGASVLFLVAYFSQDVAHFACCEPTFQSSYQGTEGWVWKLVQHTLHLVPLCLDACWHTDNSLASLFVQRQQVVSHKLDVNDPVQKELHEALETVGSWANAQDPPHHKTTHWWWNGLSTEATNAFALVARSQELRDILFEKLYPKSTHVVEPLEGMNEVYVACKTHNHNSDTVFYKNHVDGPYGIFPLVHVYRSMIACTPNEQIETIFPMAGPKVRHALSTGEMFSFDFHREVHRIGHVEGGKENEGHRICMKVHYLIYPRFLGPLGRLLGRMSVHYNANFRTLFLSTISPDHWFSKFMAWQVIFFTDVFNSFEVKIGWANICYLTLVTALSLAFRSYGVFFCATSFAHYFVYTSTYHQRKDIAFGAFKRDALLYKTLALVQAGFQFLTLFDYSKPDYIALGLLVSGFGLATLAASRLGVDRTYFGWELGEISGDYVARFPYGVIPHPMILGGVIGWLGFHKLDAFRAAWPIYVPLHVALYTAHAVQEHFAIHTTGKLVSEGTATSAKKVQ